jgi:serine/threonine protein kinase
MSSPVHHHHIIEGNYFDKGTFGEISHCLIDEKEAIVKKIYCDTMNHEKLAFQELIILKNTNHENIIKLLHHEWISPHNELWLYMEFGGITLVDAISENIIKNKTEQNKILYQIVDGVQYLHSILVIHRDLKCDNIVVDNDLKVKIIDFGLAYKYTQKTNENTLTGKCGSRSYAAPEILAGQRYNGFFTDVWSLGIIVFALYFNHLPFQVAHNTDKSFKYVTDAQFRGETTITAIKYFYKSTKIVPLVIESLLNDMLSISKRCDIYHVFRFLTYYNLK